MYVLGIPERPRRRAEELVGPRALAASILLPSRISWLENIRSGPYLVRSRGLKDCHRRLSLLTERSLQDSWTPPLSTASSCSGPLGTSATLSAMPPAVFLQTPLPAVPQGPVPGLSPPGGTNTWRSSKQPENLKTGLEASPPNVHMISEDWGGLMLPGQFHGGGRICTGPDLGEGAGRAHGCEEQGEQRKVPNTAGGGVGLSTRADGSFTSQSRKGLEKQQNLHPSAPLQKTPQQGPVGWPTARFLCVELTGSVLNLSCTWAVSHP